MTKKIIIIMLISVVAVSFLFAEKKENFVTVTGSPYGKQFITTSISGNYGSDYGFGFKAGYRYSLNMFLLGADISYQNYIYNFNNNRASLNNLQILAKIGGKIDLSDRISLNGDVGIGVDVGLSRVTTNFTNLLIGASGSVSFYFCEDVAVLSGLDFSIEWANSGKSEFKSTQFNLIPMLGIEVNF